MCLELQSLPLYSTISPFVDARIVGYFHIYHVSHFFPHELFSVEGEVLQTILTDQQEVLSFDFLEYQNKNIVVYYFMMYMVPVLMVPDFLWSLLYCLWTAIVLP